MFSSFSPRAKRSRLAATTLQRRSAVASVLLELCGVINTFDNSWNGRRDGRRSGSAWVGYWKWRLSPQVACGSTHYNLARWAESADRKPVGFFSKLINIVLY